MLVVMFCFSTGAVEYSTFVPSLQAAKDVAMMRVANMLLVFIVLIEIEILKK
jgi:hypothetical protein